MIESQLRKLVRGLLASGVVWAMLLVLGVLVLVVSARPGDGPFMPLEQPAEALADSDARLLDYTHDWPYGCKWNCTARDMRLLYAYIGTETGEPVPSCQPGETVEANLWLKVHNNTATNRYGVYVMYDVQIGDTAWYWQASCISDTYVPKKAFGVDEFRVVPISYTCGNTLDLSNLRLVWSTQDKAPYNSCSDGTACPHAPSKCDYAQSPPLVLPMSVDLTSSSPDCLGQATQFEGTISHGRPPYSVTWDFGDGTAPLTIHGVTASKVRASHTYAIGDWMATLTVDCVNQCNARAQTTAVVVEDCRPDLGVEMSDTPDPVLAGEDLAYDITATNHGPGDATGVVMTDTLPEQADFVSATPDQGTCSESGGVVTCELGGLADGESSGIRIVVRPWCPELPCEMVIHNQAQVACGEEEPDPDPHLNSVGADTTVVDQVLEDTTAPVITCPPDIEVPADPGQAYAAVDPGMATASDDEDPDPQVTGVRSDGQPLDALFPLGTMTITWTAVDRSGNSASCEQLVTVYEPLVASFTTQPINGSAPLTVHFSDTTSGGKPPYGHGWDFGDGHGSSERNPLHTYRGEGTWTVTLTVTDSRGSSDTARDTVGTLPYVELAATKYRPLGDVTATWRFWYHIHVTNTGTALAQNVVIIDELPDGVAPWAVVASSGGVYDEASHTVTWHVPSLGVGHSIMVWIQMQTWSHAAGTRIVNRVAVTADRLPEPVITQDVAYVHAAPAPTPTPTATPTATATPTVTATSTPTHTPTPTPALSEVFLPLLKCGMP